MSDDAIILLCRCAHHQVLPEGVVNIVSEGLRAQNVAFVPVDDLCGLAAERDASLRGLVGTSDPVTIVACHPRAIKWLLHAAGLAIAEAQLQFLDMRAMSGASILERLSSSTTSMAAAIPDKEPAGDSWLPWFPVIDHDRCKQCRQCVSFCLFGVYALSPDGKAHVANPHNCKNNCPACARICPEAAIMFPKLGDAEAPLNGGEVGDESELKARARINVREILGDDIYAALAERRRRAGARRLVRPAREQAEQERAACAAKTVRPDVASRSAGP